MSRSFRESNLAQLREALLQLNTEFFAMLGERRALTLQIQEFKESSGRYSHFDPEREKGIFNHLNQELKRLTLKELLAFSLIMEDQAMAMAPGSYPAWSGGIHLEASDDGLASMINPIMLKVSHPELFDRLVLCPEFAFLKQF